MKKININEVSKVADAKIIDVREVVEYQQGSIPGAVNIPLTGLVFNAKKFLNKDEQYYILCQGGGRSMQACLVLSAKGYDVTNLEGGYAAYQK